MEKRDLLKKHVRMILGMFVFLSLCYCYWDVQSCMNTAQLSAVCNMCIHVCLMNKWGCLKLMNIKTLWFRVCVCVCSISLKSLGSVRFLFLEEINGRIQQGSITLLKSHSKPFIMLQKNSNKCCSFQLSMNPW